MTELVQCPACGIKTRGGRDVCPRCETSLAGAPVCETTRAVSAYSRRTPGLDTKPLQQTDTHPPESKRRRFEVLALRGMAALIAGLVVLGAVRVWVQDGVTTFGTSSAMAGEQATAPTAPETQPVPAETDGGSPGAALPETDSLPSAAPSASVSTEAGNLLFETGEFQAARAQFEAAVAIAPDDAQARNNLGQTLVRLEQQNQAVPHFEEAVRLDPERWAYHFNLAHTLGDLGQWNQAVVRYQRAVELFPDDFATRYNLGRALHERGDDRAAVAAYLEAIALAPGEPTFYLSLAQSYERLARPADVVAAYARYLELEPESTQADVIRTRMDALQPPADAGQNE